ncbi:MAG: HupE/UreJ family protein [Verrucomicrobia bacterium]|nr:HupE/UreJ family protein [Verrucomicrobiota bacterium]
MLKGSKSTPGALHRLWKIGLIFFLLSGSAVAHNPDTSYTRIKVFPTELEFRFTFDVTTLLSVADLDANRDRRVTLEELFQNALVIQKFLREHISISFDSTKADFGEPEPPVFSENAQFVPEKDYHQTLAHFVFRKAIREMPTAFTLLFDIFDQLGERHTNLTSIEQNGQRDEGIVFTRFEPDYLYDTTVFAPLSDLLLRFLKLGVKHIFLGYDHILFLLALVVVSRFWDLVKIITAFTVAHTITLILAALELVRLPPRLIETAIAVTIMYVALENLWAKEARHRWVLTFAFGLVHGFGFANVLRELGLPAKGVIRCLLSFNVGVELGQIGIVLLVLPVALWLGKQSFSQNARVTASLLIFLFGLGWFVERAFGLRFMPI